MQNNKLTITPGENILTQLHSHIDVSHWDSTSKLKSPVFNSGLIPFKELKTKHPKDFIHDPNNDGSYKIPIDNLYLSQRNVITDIHLASLKHLEKEAFKEEPKDINILNKKAFTISQLNCKLTYHQQLYERLRQQQLSQRDNNEQHDFHTLIVKSQNIKKSARNIREKLVSEKRKQIQLQKQNLLELKLSKKQQYGQSGYNQQERLKELKEKVLARYIQIKDEENEQQDSKIAIDHVYQSNDQVVEISEDHSPRHSQKGNSPRRSQRQKTKEEEQQELLKEIYKYGINDMLEDSEMEIEQHTGSEHTYKSKRYLDIKTKQKKEQMMSGIGEYMREKITAKQKGQQAALQMLPEELKQAINEDQLSKNQVLSLSSRNNDKAFRSFGSKQSNSYSPPQPVFNHKKQTEQILEKDDEDKVSIQSAKKRAIQKNFTHKVDFQNPVIGVKQQTTPSQFKIRTLETQKESLRLNDDFDQLTMQQMNLQMQNLSQSSKSNESHHSRNSTQLQQFHSKLSSVNTPDERGLGNISARYTRELSLLDKNSLIVAESIQENSKPQDAIQNPKTTLRQPLKYKHQDEEMQTSRHGINSKLSNYKNDNYHFKIGSILTPQRSNRVLSTEQKPMTVRLMKQEFSQKVSPHCVEFGGSFVNKVIKERLQKTRDIFRSTHQINFDEKGKVFHQRKNSMPNTPFSARQTASTNRFHTPQRISKMINSELVNAGMIRKEAETQQKPRQGTIIKQFGFLSVLEKRMTQMNQEFEFLPREDNIKTLDSYTKRDPYQPLAYVKSYAKEIEKPAEKQYETINYDKVFEKLITNEQQQDSLQNLDFGIGDYKSSKASQRNSQNNNNSMVKTLSRNMSMAGTSSTFKEKIEGTPLKDLKVSSKVEMMIKNRKLMHEFAYGNKNNEQHNQDLLILPFIQIIKLQQSSNTST